VNLSRIKLISKFCGIDIRQPSPSETSMFIICSHYLAQLRPISKCRMRRIIFRVYATPCWRREKFLWTIKSYVTWLNLIDYESQFQRKWNINTILYDHYYFFVLFCIFVLFYYHFFIWFSWFLFLHICSHANLTDRVPCKGGNIICHRHRAETWHVTNIIVSLDGNIIKYLWSTITIFKRTIFVY
jgi:hypothetical protein